MLKVVETMREVQPLIPRPWNRERFVAAVGDYRGRTIRLTAMDSPVLRGSPCGVWLVFEEYDQIIYDANTSDYHADQTILHEVGHMVLDHHSCGGVNASLAKLFPDVDIAAAKSVMARSRFEDPQEIEAETFADMLMASAVSRFRKSGSMDDLWG
ncbi:regulator [Rhodococcoides trifolii]|nr:regulator [Rhodococcus trifolii]